MRVSPKGKHQPARSRPRVVRRLTIEATYDLEQWRGCPASPARPSGTKIQLARKESILYARFLFVIMELPPERR